MCHFHFWALSCFHVSVLFVPQTDVTAFLISSAGALLIQHFGMSCLSQLWQHPGDSLRVWHLCVEGKDSLSLITFSILHVYVFCSSGIQLDNFYFCSKLSVSSSFSGFFYVELSKVISVILLCICDYFSPYLDDLLFF